MFRRFIIFSGFASAVNLAVGYVLYGIMGLNDGRAYALAVSLAFAAGMGVSFVLNRRYTYPASGRPVATELCDFLLVSLGGMTLTTSVAWALNKYAHTVIVWVTEGFILPEAVAHICAVGLTAFYSFFAHKLVSFRAQQQTSGQTA